ncbi:MAG: hypothetical protein QXP31_11440 [Pyrobaculum sp.]
MYKTLVTLSVYTGLRELACGDPAAGSFFIGAQVGRSKLPTQLLRENALKYFI